MNYLKIYNPSNDDHCYAIVSFNDKINMTFLDSLFDEKLTVHQSTLEIITEEKEKGHYLVWEFLEANINSERLQRLIDEIKWVNGAKITFGK